MRKWLSKSNVSLGILIIRVGLGIQFIQHGLPKLTAGPALWHKLGLAMGNIGITFLPTFWGFMASASECVGGLLILLGLFTRPAALLMAATMAIATLSHLAKGDTLAKGASHPFELLIVFIGLYFLGAGLHSLDNKILKK